MLQYKSSPYLACFAAGLFSFFNLSQFSLFNVISSNLLADFKLHSISLGVLASLYLFGNALWLVPGGFLLDNFKIHRVGLCFMALAVLATIIMAVSTSLDVSATMRFIQGMASAMSLLISIRMASSWFPQNTGIAIGFIIAFALSGGIFGNEVFTPLTNDFGWRNALLAEGAIGLLFLTFMFFFLNEKPQEYTVKKPNLNFIKNITGNQKIVLIGLYIGLMNLPVFIFTGLWGNLYLRQTHGVVSSEASFTTSLLFLGIIISSPLVGYFSDAINNRILPMTLGAISSLFVILLLISSKTVSLIYLKLLFLLLGGCISTQILGYALVSDRYAQNIPNTITAIVAFIENFIGGLGQIIFSYLLGLKWNHSVIDKIPFYSHSNYFTALLLLPFSFMICFILSQLLKSVNDS